MDKPDQGHRPNTMSSLPDTIQVACGVLVNPKGQVWLLRRDSKQPHPGYWEFPGGKLEAGESGPAAMQRELMEELGIAVAVESLITVVSHAYSEQTVELFFYHCRPLSSSPLPQLQVHDRQVWVWPDELLSYRLLPGDLKVARDELIPWLHKLAEPIL